MLLFARTFVNFGTGLNDIVGLVMAAMFYAINSTEPAG